VHSIAFSITLWYGFENSVFCCVATDAQGGGTIFSGVSSPPAYGRCGMRRSQSLLGMRAGGVAGDFMIFLWQARHCWL
jgi:hypothetical protein